MNTLILAPNTTSSQRWLRPWVSVEPGELRGLLCAFGCALSMFAAYSMLRPIRETMGITSGVAALPLLFWGTFVAMLVVQPLYGWVVSRYRRTIALPRVYAFFSATLLLFYAWFFLQADHTWVARVYFVWVSVLNLFVVAVFWSLMADVFDREQAGRLFGFIAGGLSIGGLLGPLLAGWLAKPLGTINLLPISAALLLLSATLMHQVARWHATRDGQSDAAGNRADAALRGSAWAAFAQVARSPYLIGIGVFVLLLTTVSTIMYVEQGRSVSAAISNPDARTALFAQIDFAVQAIALVIQMLLFGRLLRRFGFAVMLISIPLIMLIAFATIGIAPSFNAVIAAIIVRRIGEYAVTRPCRDMLFTVVSREEKYKAKSLIDTFIYRGGDALSASAYAGIVALSSSTSTATGVSGVVVCVLWLLLAVWLARRFAARSAGAAAADVVPAHR